MTHQSHNDAKTVGSFIGSCKNIILKKKNRLYEKGHSIPTVWNLIPLRDYRLRIINDYVHPSFIELLSILV